MHPVLATLPRPTRPLPPHNLASPLTAPKPTALSVARALFPFRNTVRTNPSPVPLPAPNPAPNPDTNPTASTLPQVTAPTVPTSRRLTKQKRSSHVRRWSNVAKKPK